MTKTLLITGGSRGIGATTAIAFAKEGYDVAVNYASNAQKAEAVVEQVLELGRRAIAIKGDVSNYEEAKNIVKETFDAFGRIDVLINNAAIKRDGSIDTLSEEDFDRVMAINVKGIYTMVKHTINTIPENHPLRIINISSGTGIIGKADQVNYAASKFAVNGMSVSLGKELGPRGITVNAVAPGLTETDMTDYVTEERKEQQRNTIPLKRLGSTQDIADACVFLASDKASFINGQIIPVNGGIHTA